MYNHVMADIYTFTPRPKREQKDNTELDRLRAKLLELHDARETIVKEIRYTRDAIKLLEKGEQ
jgi:hypothetical protein